MQLDWKNLGFQFLPTHGHAQSDFADGKWGPLEFKADPVLNLHVAANALHYGQAIFEGLKAFRAKDGTVSIFRPDRNAERMRLSAGRLVMEAPSDELFLAACKLAVEKNIDFVPPYGTGASLYLRPLLIGTEPTVGIKPSDTYSFIVLVTPVGPYYKSGFKPVEALVMREYDRAAPNGTGRAKTAGNYAASLLPGLIGKKKGFPIILFADPKEGKYVDEFGTSNFLGITPAGEYKTPESGSILQSITNESLQVLAEESGLKVVRGPIALDDLQQFSEVGACGTAAVITPVHAVHDGDRVTRFGEKDVAGATLTRLYKTLQGIQYGEIPDTHGWLVPVKG
ncbi:MAG TPA: branched-chain amino acid aminotransferase [Fibrobacteria bacterium]|jgi:branched-chain amino acid aminotransferase|nr:branched-chain amino acid aminotransferase [Fibrobacteria bacterium]